MTLNIENSEGPPPKTGGRVIFFTNFLSVFIVVLAAAWSLDMPRHAGVSFYPAQFLSLVLGLAVCITYLTKNIRSQVYDGLPAWYDLAAAVLAFALGIAMSLRYPALVDLVLLRPTEAVIIGALILPLILEALRRAVGPTLVIVVLLFIAYAFWGNNVPGRLMGRSQDWEKVASYLTFDVNGVLGVPLQIASTVVIGFILFGVVLNKSGGAKFFTDTALILIGNLRGGAMKIAVIASAIFGSISGSAVANVMSTGVVTIPMIKRTGYPAHRAAAIEAVASTGGQLLPPVMGASAFLMAEFLYTPYSTVALAALVPGILYYAALFIQADLEAVRHNIAAVPQSERPRGREVITGLHFPLGFVVLMLTLFYLNWQPAKSALAATATVLLTATIFGYQGRRFRLQQIWFTLARAGNTSIDLILICAAAGMVIGVLNMTGLSFNLSYALVQLGGGSKITLLLMSAIVCIVLGMGLPTLGVYVLLATLVAPALIELGVDRIAAHLYVLYFGMMSMITPPVAIAAFAAAGVAGARPMHTGLEAMRFGWPAYIVPFLFVYSPSLLLRGTVFDMITSITLTAMGVVVVSVALTGFFRRKLNLSERIILTFAGAATFFPHEAINNSYTLNFIGLFVTAAMYFWVTNRSLEKKIAKDS